jgi:hypothetical protein
MKGLTERQTGGKNVINAVQGCNGPKKAAFTKKSLPSMVLEAEV